MGETWTREEFFKKLEDTGEADVRINLAGSIYGPPRSEKRILVEQWLFERERRAEDAKHATDKAFAREANDIALAANALASAANKIAERAEKRARTANAIAIAAAMIAIVSVGISYLDLKGFISPGPTSPSAVSSPP